MGLQIRVENALPNMRRSNAIPSFRLSETESTILNVSIQAGTPIGLLLVLTYSAAQILVQKGSGIPHMGIKNT
jgi:hypothetical protein